MLEIEQKLLSWITEKLSTTCVVALASIGLLAALMCSKNRVVRIMQLTKAIKTVLNDHLIMIEHKSWWSTNWRVFNDFNLKP